MAEEIPVDAVVTEKTHVGKVQFPVTIPERMAELFEIPGDLQDHAKALGIDEATIKFLLAALRGKWALTAQVNLQDLAVKTGMQYSQMDEIIRGLLKKNYARLNDRLDLYRFWVSLLHVKGTRFVTD